MKLIRGKYRIDPEMKTCLRKEFDKAGRPPGFPTDHGVRRGRDPIDHLTQVPRVPNLERRSRVQQTAEPQLPTDTRRPAIGPRRPRDGTMSDEINAIGRARTRHSSPSLPPG